MNWVYRILMGVGLVGGALVTGGILPVALAPVAVAVGTAAGFFHESDKSK